VSSSSAHYLLHLYICNSIIASIIRVIRYQLEPEEFLSDFEVFIVRIPQDCNIIGCQLVWPYVTCFAAHFASHWNDALEKVIGQGTKGNMRNIVQSTDHASIPKFHTVSCPCSLFVCGRVLRDARAWKFSLSLFLSLSLSLSLYIYIYIYIYFFFLSLSCLSCLSTTA